MSDPNDPMAEIRASFFIECEELLEALNDALQELDDGNEDPELINVVFRAVHSIKGGGGAFGLEKLVRFAHRYETALDEVRSGRLKPSAENIKLFFQAADHLSDLVRICRDGGEWPEAAGQTLLAAFDTLLGEEDEEDADGGEEAISFQPMGLSLDLDLPDGEEDTPAGPPTYLITFSPADELFETGNEPFLILRALGALGEMEVSLDASALPSLSALAPESSYLTWNVTLTADVDEAEIQSVFEFVDGLCTLKTEREDTSSGSTLPPIDALDPGPAPLPPLSAEEPPAGQETGLAPEPSPSLDKTTKEAPPATTPKPSASKDTATNAPAAKSSSNAAKSVVRVDLDRIERLVNLVGELVINQAMLSQSLEEAGLSTHSDAMNGLEEFQRLTRDIQDSVMMIRAQPVKSLFQRMSRIVREASSAVGKDVRLVTVGDATEVDKTVIERLADPLTHMIRNAVDHGLEPTEKRVANGKSPQGQVQLTAAHRSGRVVIEVSDDGGGINREKVLSIATEKGLVPEGANLSDTEIDNLLFLPGFSTAKEVSDLSGRGVGMDVVKTSIQALGGRITITSQEGVGTTFSISLPLTLAVLDGMVVNVAAETLVLPLNVVVETLSLRSEDLDQIGPGSYVVRVRGSFVPLYDLGVELGYRQPKQNYVGAIVLVINQEDGNQAALIIDAIQDQRQVVIKGLDESFYRAPGIAAATILGDGQIALILDPSDVIANASGRHMMSASIAAGEQA